MVDEEEFEIEVVSLAPAIDVEVVEPVAKVSRDSREVGASLSPELREVFDEVLSSMPKVNQNEALAIVKRWVPALGPDRFYAVFWLALGSQVSTAAGLSERLAEAFEEGKKTRYADAEVKRYAPTGTPERRMNVATRFGGIIRQIMSEPGFDYRAEVAKACEELGIRRQA